MKVLISAGARSDIIEGGLRDRFKSGGVDFIIVPFIDDIDDVYQRGEYFDKAIIVEQSWTHDRTDTDEVSIRNRINRFATACSNRALDNVEYVFLTQDDESANTVYEEILAIQSNSTIIVKKPKYTVTFFSTLVTNEPDKLDQSLIFKPVYAEEIQVQPVEDTPEVPKGPEYEVKWDFDPETGMYGDGSNANRLDINEGINLNKPVEQPIQPEVIPEPEPVISEEPQEISDPYDDVYNQDDSGFEESGEIPDMSGMPGGFNTADFDEPAEPPIEPEQIPQFEENQTFEIPNDTFEPDIEPELEKSGEIPDWSGDPGSPNFSEYDEPAQQGSQINLNKEEPDFYGEQEGDAMGQGYNEDPNDYGGQELGGFPDQEYYGGGYSEDPNQGQPNGFSDQDYDGYNPDLDRFNEREYEDDVPAPARKQFRRSNLNDRQIRDTLDAFANRGNSILITGCGGCGTSTIALNLANIINRLGYTVLLVDLDTENKTQSYISKDNFDCLEAESAGLMAAVNSSSGTGINAHIAIVRQGFHLLTMGMASDSAPIEKLLHRDKFSRFINLAKTSHNFVIYDVPFKSAVGFASEFTFMADNIVITVDCSNWGITKTMLAMCNFDSDDMQQVMFNRGQLLFNKQRVIHKVMGRKIKTATDITKVMDYKVKELLGEDPGYYFQTMHICGLINDDPSFESGWYEGTQYSDTQQGGKIFTELLKNIVLKQ